MRERYCHPEKESSPARERAGLESEDYGVAEKTLDRSATAASRDDSGARPKRCSIVARIDVVSCDV
jgi:hypothetical protein